MTLNSPHGMLLSLTPSLGSLSLQILSSFPKIREDVQLKRPMTLIMCTYIRINKGFLVAILVYTVRHQNFACIVR